MKLVNMTLSEDNPFGRYCDGLHLRVVCNGTRIYYIKDGIIVSGSRPKYGVSSVHHNCSDHPECAKCPGNPTNRVVILDPEEYLISVGIMGTMEILDLL